MRNLMSVLLAVCVVLFCVVGSTFGAGGGLIEPILDNGNSFGGTFTLGGNNGPQWHSYAYENESMDYTSGSFSLMLYEPVSFSDANWRFWTDSYDTQYWNASCYLYGYLEGSEETPQNQHWSQSMSQGDLRMDASLSLNCYNLYENTVSGLTAQLASLQAILDDPGDYNVEEIQAQIASLQEYLQNVEVPDVDVMSLHGNFSIQPSELLSSNFSYQEYLQNWYTYPNGYDQPPVIEQVHAWSGQYYLHGRFVAPTIEEAQAMGAPYAQDVPEPSTIVLMAIGLLTSLAAYLRRR